MNAPWYRCRPWVLALVVVSTGFALGGCNDGGSQTVKCFTDNDCPLGQQCVAGNCQLPGDPGVVTCQDINQCPIGQWCNNGICENIPEEPRDEDGGVGDDGSVNPDGDGSPPGDGDDQADQGPDQDQADYSRWNFSIALRRSGNSGPASQCVDSLRPPANSGPVLDPASAPGGYSLAGTFRDSNGTALPGARVSLVSERPECLPEPKTTDGSGTFNFYLKSGGPYHLQAVAADGRVGNQRVASLPANTNQDIVLPAATPLTGGPLCEDCANSVALTGWTVETWYRDGPNANKLAHSGVVSGDQPFSIPVVEGVAYDLIAAPPAGGPLMPRQVVLEDACQLQSPFDCTNESNASRAWLRVRPGFDLSGTASVGGTGSPQSVIELKEDTDLRFALSVAAQTGGSFQARLPLGVWNLVAMPAPNAFDVGGMLFASPGLSIYQDTTKNAQMAVGRQVEFSGRVIDGGGVGVGDAQLRLIVNDTPMVEGSYAWCDPNFVQTQADGSFRVRCNLTP